MGGRSPGVAVSLTGEYPGDCGSGGVGLASNHSAPAVYREAELIHARWAM